MENSQLSVGQRVKCFDEKWTGKIRRISDESALIAWTWCGSLPTDVCTWVMFDQIYR